MARGQILTIPNGTAQLVTTLSREQKASLSLLNPNDGICYVKMNSPASNTVAAWDYKVPSQSYCQLPGPWESLGVFYLDQSGSGRTAEVNVYELDSQIAVPSFVAIGRAVQSAGTTVDISSGSQPANPPAGTVRLWIDGTGQLHVLDSTGHDETYVDTTSPLGADLFGTISAAHIGVQNGSMLYGRDNTGTLMNAYQPTGDNFNAWFVGTGGLTLVNYNNSVRLWTIDNSGNLVLTTGTIKTNSQAAVSQSGDIGVSRGNNTGVVYFGNGNQYLYWTGTYFLAQGGDFHSSGNLYIGAGGGAGIYANGWLHSNDGSNGLVVADAGTLYFRSASTNYMFDSGGTVTMTGSLNVSGGGSYGQACTGPYFGASSYMWTPTIYLGGNGAPPYIQNAGAAIRYMSASDAVHSFETTSGGYGNLQAKNITANGYLRATADLGTNSGYVYFRSDNAIAIQWDGTYLRHTHSIIFNTTGNQIVWPNGSYISGNAGYVQGSQENLKENIVDISDSNCLAQVLDPRMGVKSYNWPGDSRESLGFVVEDVAQVLPNYVIRDDKDIPTGYVPQELVALLWGAVRELNARIPT